VVDLVVVEPVEAGNLALHISTKFYKKLLVKNNN